MKFRHLGLRRDLAFWASNGDFILCRADISRFLLLKNDRLNFILPPWDRVELAFSLSCKNFGDKLLVVFVILYFVSRLSGFKQLGV